MKAKISRLLMLLLLVIGAQSMMAVEKAMPGVTVNFYNCERYGTGVRVEFVIIVIRVMVLLWVTVPLRLGQTRYCIPIILVTVSYQDVWELSIIKLIVKIPERFCSLTAR